MAFFVHLPAAAEPIEAVQWFPGLLVAGVSHESAGYPGSPSLLPVPPHAYLTTDKERLTVFAGDWIITEPTGRRHICHHELFQRSYAPFEHTAALP